MPVLTVSDAGKTFGRVTALDGASFELHEGELLALLGPNGAGKTTLILHLNGILTAQEGTVAVGGRPVSRATLAEVRRTVGVVFQDPDDQLFMPTVREDVAFGPSNLGWGTDEVDTAVADALDVVGMTAAADRSPHHLSFGERRRVALATVLAMRPDVLVLDEPSSNLDPVARRELAEIVHGLDVTVVLVTHDLPYALQLCDRAVVLDDGRLVADGPIAELLSDEAAMAAHRLELPYGFAVTAASGR
jgi:cobalt/nickel transport system ATP-binding protein